MRDLGPVVQSIVSLTTSLRRQLVKYMPTKLSNTLLFLLTKCDSHIFFSTKNNCICNVYVCKFNETLTNDVVNFEQPAPDCSAIKYLLFCCFLYSVHLPYCALDDWLLLVLSHSWHFFFPFIIDVIIHFLVCFLSKSEHRRSTFGPIFFLFYHLCFPFSPIL